MTAPNPISSKVVSLAATSTESSAPATKRRRADWEAIERDYRTGKFSDQELHNKHGYDENHVQIITRQAISKRAKEKAWPKDLTVAVRQATKAKVLQAQAVANRKEVADTVAEKVAAATSEQIDSTLTAVLAVAEVNKQVIMGHRDDLHQLRNLTMSMVGELRAVSMSPARVQELHDMLTSGQELTAAQIAEARDAFTDLTKLPSRVLTVQRLSQAMTRLQQMERVAFGLDEPDDPAGADVGPKTLTDAQRASRLAFLLSTMASAEVPDAD
jgi:hypothetical protein